MPKAKVKKAKKITMTEAKAEAARLGLEVSPKYDRRYLNTWLFTIGQDIDPVERKQIVHKPKAKKQPLTMAELINLAKGEKNAIWISRSAYMVYYNYMDNNTIWLFIRPMKDFTIFINKREIKVPYRIYLCHCTTELKTLMPNDEYSLYLRDYNLHYTKLVDYIATYVSFNNRETKKSIVYDSIMRSKLFTPLHSLLLASWYGEYFRTQYVRYKGKIYLDDIVDAGVNYSKLETLSKAYLSLYPLTKFYKRLTLDYDETRYFTPFYEKEFVTVDNIRETLSEMDTKVTYEDIKEDLDLHSILCPYKDYYIWGSKPLWKWFLNVDHSTLFRININKVLSVEHN